MSKAVKALSIILILAALFGLVGGGMSLKDALDSKDYFGKKGEETDAAFTKLEDGLAQLQENEQAYLDGRDKYEDGLKQYEEGKAQYEEGKKTYEDGLKEYENGKAQLADAAKQLQSGRAELAAGKQKLDAGEAQFANTLMQQKNEAAQTVAGADYNQLPADAQAQIDAAVNDKINQANQVNTAVKQLMGQGLTKEQAVNAVANSQVAQQVDANNDQIVAAVTAAVRQNVEQKVRAGAEELKPALREQAAQEKFGASYDQLPEEAKAAIDAGVNEKVEAGIPAEVEKQMASEQVGAIIDQNVADQKAKLIEANMPDAVALVNTAVTTTESIQALQKGRSDYAAGRAKLANGEAQYADGQKKLTDAEKQLTDGKAALDDAEQQLADAEKQLADGKEQLKQFEDGRDQIIDGLNTVISTEPDNGLKSIADRLGKGFSFMKNDTDLDIEKGKEVVAAGRSYSSDSGELITKEVVTRVVGAALALVGSLLALVAGFLGLGSKFKGSGVSSILSAVLGAGGLAALLIAGSHYSEQAGASAVKLVLAAAGVLAVAALANGIASLSASKKANV